MRVKLRISDKYETAPTGETVDKIFEKVLDEMHRRMDTRTNQDSHVATRDDLTTATVIIRKEEQDLNVNLKSEFGEQNNGYLIELEIRDSGNSVNEEAAKEAYEEIESILHDVTKIR